MIRKPDAGDILTIKMQCPLVGAAHDDDEWAVLGIRHRIDASGIPDDWATNPDLFNAEAVCGARCAILLAPDSPSDFDHCYGIKWDPNDRSDWGPDMVGRWPCPTCSTPRQIVPTDFVIDPDGTIHNVSNRFALPNSQETA